MMTCRTGPGKLILTLSTRDGFSVTFAVSASQIATIANVAAKAELAAIPNPTDL
jgi:hypothetical protein